MIVGIEIYFEFNIGEQRHQFRCFVPQDTDRMKSSTSHTNSSALNFAGYRGLIDVVQMANMVIDVANKAVCKDRMGRFLSIVNDDVVLLPVTESDVKQCRQTPLIDYTEMLNQVEEMTRPPVPLPITEFTGDYHFLSNFHPATFVWNHIMWPNSEAAYQAAKSADYGVWLDFAKMRNPANAKRAGKLVKMRSDWEDVKLGIMRDIVFEKFNQNPDLKQRLIATGNAQLEEGNVWKDTFWGVCPAGSGIGHNHLGKILMDIRRSLRMLNF